MATLNKITIDLNKSLNPEAFSKTSNILQNAAFSRLLEIINAHAEQIKKSEEKTYPALRSHNSVFISGERGSGKTTFLLNIKTAIKGKLENPPYILDIIDPTLIHDNDNFLSIVLGRIADTVKKRNFDLLSDKNGDSVKEFFNKLSEVAELSEAICNSKKSTGLDNILDEQNALNLEQGIHELMKKAVDVLKCSFLVLPIDDIDMSFIHGFEVLEKIRKYLATPYIMPVISGDIEMYHRIFTIEFFRQMTHNDRISDEGIKRLYSKIDSISQAKAENDSEAKDMYFISKSYDLSDRYLEKVLPRNRRIRLINVRDIVKDENISVKINEEHKWNEQSISNIVAQIKESFNLNCGYVMRDNNIFNSKDAPVPFNNLREFFQFLAQVKDAFVGENVSYALLNKRIMDFYEYGGGTTDRTIFDFAKANCNAYGGESQIDLKAKEVEENFSVKRFAKFSDIEKYFPYSEPQNKLLAYYPKPGNKAGNKNKNDFKNPGNNLEKLFYIITYEADIQNGSRIYVSPDKFFLWITAKLFSPLDIASDGEKYSFGFDNEIFMNDNKRIQKGNTIDDGDEETEKRADDYEKIKYEDTTNRELYVDELMYFRKVDCSSSFIYCVYDKFRANIDAILSKMKKETRNSEELRFSKFAKKLIIVYVNALALASTQNKRYSKNNICLSTENVSELKKRDMAYKWNINNWKCFNFDRREPNKIANLMAIFIHESRSHSKGGDPLFLEPIKTSNLMQDFLECLLGVFGLKDEDKNNKSEKEESFLEFITIEDKEDPYLRINLNSQEKEKSENQIKTNFTKYIKQLKKMGINGVNLFGRIRASAEFEDLKTIKPLPKSWERRVRKILPEAVFVALKKALK